MKVKNITSLTNKKTMTITLISILILSAMLGATAYAVDGSGTCVVSPTTVVAGSIGNTLTFTFTATESMDGGAINIAMPVGWSAPQGTSGAIGYTTATSTGTIGAPTFASQVVTIPITTLPAAGTITVVYGDGGGDSGATAQIPSVPATFVTKSKLSAGTLTEITASPTVTVDPGVLLDKEGYRTGDSVTVTVSDWAENSESLLKEVVSVTVTSDTIYPNTIVVALRETGVDTGVFKGSFKLVDFTPGVGELLVSTDDTITVTYAALPDVTAVVDDTLQALRC